MYRKYPARRMPPPESFFVILLKSPSKSIFALTLIGCIILLALPANDAVNPLVLRSAAVILLAIGLWSTAVVPSFMGSLIFMFAAMVAAIAPANVVFSGFHSGAMWLVFGGLVVGLGVKRSGLDVRLVEALLHRIPTSYVGTIYGVFWAAFSLAWIVPSAAGRVALLVPIMLSLADKLGFEEGSKGRAGLVLAAAMGTMAPAFAILPANVPNMSLFGAVESLYGIRLTYADYLVLNFPVIAVGALILYPALLSFMFKDTPAAREQCVAATPWKEDEVRLLLIVAVALVLWITDTLHGISPAWVSLGAALVCVAPRIGMLPPSALGKDIDFTPLLFLAGVIGLGGVATHTGVGNLIAEFLLTNVPLHQGQDGENFGIIAAIATVIGLFTTMPAQPAIMAPMAEAMAQASGWSLMSVLMAPVVTWTMFPFFYQAPPVVLAVALGNLRISWVIKMLVAYMVISAAILLPLHFLWGQYLGYFKVAG